MFLDCTSVLVRTRQRDELSRQNVGQLKMSIASKGLFHAPVVWKDGADYVLTAGAHRKVAMEELHTEGVPFFYDGLPVPSGKMPVVNLFDLSPADLMEAELEENIIRHEVTWQEKARALTAIHELRLKENPKQTFTDTARELRELAGKPVDSPVQHWIERTQVRNAVIIAEHLHHPEVANARNQTEALGIVYKRLEAQAEAELLKRRYAKAEKTPKLIEVRHGDFTEILPTLDQGHFDLIVADLPYGIGANEGGFRQRTVEHHNYDDSPDTARELLQAVIVEGFRVCKPRANLFIFGDVDFFPLFKQACSAMGWKPFRTPVIWQKSESEGLAPWGREGFRRTYEMVFFATKGKKGLLQSPVDIINERRVARNKRRYGPEKPVGLLEELIECSTMPGDIVLDPCCGAGSTLMAARHLKRKALGIELNEAAYNLALIAAERDPEETEPQPKVESLA